LNTSFKKKTDTKKMISSLKDNKVRLIENKVKEESVFEKSPVKENRFKGHEFSTFIYAKGLSDKLSE